MSKLAQLREREELTPSELKRFGKRVKLFAPERDAYLAETRVRLFKEIEDYVASSGGQLYTGIHGETDWTKTRWWLKGGHLVNRTLEFAVIVP